MPVIRIGDNVRLPFASGNYGLIEDINVVYVANQPPVTILYIRTVSGQLTMKFAEEVAPLKGTITTPIAPDFADRDIDTQNLEYAAYVHGQDKTGTP